MTQSPHREHTDFGADRALVASQSSQSSLSRPSGFDHGELSRAEKLAGFLDRLGAPSPSQLWLERAAAQLREERDPGGTKKASRDKIVIRLLARDGSDCWFCGKSLGKDITLEHLTPLALQGSWSDDNLALAHKGCNKAAGHLTRFEKEKLRDEMREGARDRFQAAIRNSFEEQ